MKSTFKTVLKTSSGEYREKGSRFLAYLHPVSFEEDIKNLIAAARKEHPKAVHHCYAYRLGHLNETYRYSDDREPSGSAGRPIYGVILSEELTDVLIIVVRYFGGTQLGIPGLINAYREASKASVLAAQVIEVKIMVRWQLSFPVNLAGAVMRSLRKSAAVILEYQSGTDELILCEVGADEAEKLKNELVNEYPFAGNLTLKQL